MQIDRTYRFRELARAAAILMSQTEDEGPSLPVIVAMPFDVADPTTMCPELAVDGELAFEYVNWRGERASRRAVGPYSIRYGTSEYHQEPQFLLTAIDLDRGQPREYALRDIVPTNLI